MEYKRSVAIDDGTYMLSIVNQVICDNEDFTTGIVCNGVMTFDYIQDNGGWYIVYVLDTYNEPITSFSIFVKYNTDCNG